MLHLPRIASAIHNYSLLPPTRSSESQRGFTLIEMIISVSIMLLILGGGIAGYLSLNERQTLIAAGQELQQYMRAAQKRARAGDKPTGCDKLLSYQVVSAGTPPTITLRAECENGIYNDNTFTFPSIVSLESNINMSFQILHGGVLNPQTVTLKAGQRQYTFDVNQGGEITGGVLENAP